MVYCRVDGVWGGASMASGMAHIDWTQSTRLHRHRERKKTKKNTGANFIPLTPLAFIDRARHVSRVLHVFGLVPYGFVSSLAAS